MSEPHDRLVCAQALHADLVAALEANRRAEHRLACLLRRMADERLYQLLGFGSVYDYAREDLDLEPRRASELLRLGRRLPDLPLLDAALASGDIGWTKAREIARVATADTEAAWIQRAREVTSRDLEREVAVAQLGEAPPKGEPERARGPARVRRSYELASTDAELVDKMFALIRGQANLRGDEIDEGAILASVARRILADAASDDDPAAPTGEPYKVVIEHCPTCARTTGVDAEVTDTIASESACDAEIIDMRPGPKRGHRTRAIPPALRRAILLRDKGRCVVAHCRNTLWVEVHHSKRWAAGGEHSEANCMLLCGVHHRMEHVGIIAIERVGETFVTEHLDGRRYVSHVGGSG